MDKHNSVSSSHIFAGCILIVLFLSLYYSVILKMVGDWSNDPNYSHGFLVPLIALYLLWQKRHSLIQTPISPSNWGLIVLISGLCIYVFGYLAAELFTMRISMLVVLAGLIISNLGMSFFRYAFLPYGYLYFMIPLPYMLYDAIAFPLKLFVAKYSVIVLQSIGISVYREGNIIMLPAITLEVADACSGIRSLMSLLALGVAYAYFSQKSLTKKIILVISTIPIAVLANAVRVIGTGILAHQYGEKAAEGFFHEFAGMVIFAVSMAMLIGVGVVLSKIGGKRKDKDKSNL